MEFREFSNPEGRDYDITSSLKGYSDSNVNSNNINPYSDQLMSLIGIVEDVTEESLQSQYGISMNEYFNPTADTIRKVEQKLGEQSLGEHTGPHL